MFYISLLLLLLCWLLLLLHHELLRFDLVGGSHHDGRSHLKCRHLDGSARLHCVHITISSSYLHWSLEHLRSCHHGRGHQLLTSCSVYHGLTIVIHQGSHVECLEVDFSWHDSRYGSHLSYRQRLNSSSCLSDWSWNLVSCWHN